MGLTYVFSGQGISLANLDTNIFDDYQDLLNKVNDYLKVNIKELINNKSKLLEDTRYSQVIIFLINHINYLKLIKTSGMPNNVIGHSLGEFNALVASSALTFDEGLFLVNSRALYMSECNGGVMYAIITKNYEELLSDLKGYDKDIFDIANYNSYNQIVISGLESNLTKAIDELKKKYRCVKLNVSGAFHSRYMEEANLKFKKDLDKIKLKNPTIPTYSCVDASLYDMNSKMLYSHMTSSVLFIDMINKIIDKGDYKFICVGLVKSISKLINEIKFGRIVRGK